jgi:DNA helicase-2/ATP-dependent DNA helicase PcrA
VIYLADLHVHSRFSRATSRNCNLVELASWAAVKGLNVVATGDFTHPGWQEEIREMLVEAQPGLFRLKPEFAASRADNILSPDGIGEVLFILNVEISSIYKAHGAVRKVHNLVFAPDFETMERISARLERIGNIRSDGRPIIGLDSRHLLEIAMECSPESFVIPAHIWTPWFSVLGSKSGFDSVEECYRDLSPHIFALETGLSSDPAMNYRLSALDGYTLISNSDTHSPSRLGREANVFCGSPSYQSILTALRAGSNIPTKVTKDSIKNCYLGRAEPFQPDQDRFVGTIEFFPEEGKYHVDGHRKCSVRLDPEETQRLNQRCPVCGHSVTVGVMNRVDQLSDRNPDFKPTGRPPFWRMIPLQEVLGQILGTGPNSKKVLGAYTEMIHRFGPELPLLCFQPLEEMAAQLPPVFIEALRRVREGEVNIKPGYDGQYGTVELFAPGETERFGGQLGFFQVSRPAKTPVKDVSSRQFIPRKPVVQPRECTSSPLPAELNERQRMAVHTIPGPVLVQAGPGSGKTFTLVQRILHLIESGGATPGEIITVTFTRKAAEEIKARLNKALPLHEGESCWVGTFHQLGLRILELLASRGLISKVPRVVGEDEAKQFLRDALTRCKIPQDKNALSRLFSRMSLVKQGGTYPMTEQGEDLVRELTACYQGILQEHNVLDMDDLIRRPVELLKRSSSDAEQLTLPWTQILVDEFQDVNKSQYELFCILAGPAGHGAFCIGDPDQAIYGFRGADKELFFRVSRDYPSCKIIHLNKNYRSQEHILTAARSVLGAQYSNEELVARHGGTHPVRIVRVASAQDEARFITGSIERLLGGSSFIMVDSRQYVPSDGAVGFRDIAVLYRLNAVGDFLEKVFMESGIPYQRSKRKKPEEELDHLDLRAEVVTLMTMHAAKGLEFPVVFIAGCEDGLVPYSESTRNLFQEQNINEEQRLLYVAMTRARKILYITMTSQRTLFGRPLPGVPSPFLPRPPHAPFEFQDCVPTSHRRTDPYPKQCHFFE